MSYGMISNGDAECLEAKSNAPIKSISAEIEEQSAMLAELECMMNNILIALTGDYPKDPNQNVTEKPPIIGIIEFNSAKIRTIMDKTKKTCCILGA